MPTKLSVNVNKIALLRNTRDNNIPDVTRLARLALDAGAHGITVHPRPDQRHIRPADVDAIARLLTRFPQAEFNIEGNPFHGLVEHCARVKPTQATLVPDAPGQKTSDHGFDLARDAARLAPVVAQLKALGCRVSLFLDADPAQVERVPATGADRCELYTEPYARGHAAGAPGPALEAIAACTLLAGRLGVGVNAGHDLSLANLADLLRAAPGIAEVSIGHALVAEALEYGIEETIRRYRDICK